MTYIFFVLSAMFGALTQLIVFEQSEQSWLPEWVFTWDLRLLSTLDAYHVWQGLWLWFSIVAGYFLPFLVWWKWPVCFVLYYVAYNAFYHIVFRKRKYWRWPIG